MVGAGCPELLVNPGIVKLQSGFPIRSGMTKRMVSAGMTIRDSSSDS